MAIMDPAEIKKIDPTIAAPNTTPAPALDASALAEPEPVVERAYINLLAHDGANLLPAVAQVPEVPKPAPDQAPKKSSVPLALVVAAILVLAISGTGGYLIISGHKTPKPVARVTPKPKSTPAPAPPTPTPPPPVVTPPPVIAAAQTVSVPTVAPTSDHPQAVTVQSKSGLWLRSSPDSSSRANIISWMPNNATVSVDQIGDFWWHGTFNGTIGYFASKYTQ